MGAARADTKLRLPVQHVLCKDICSSTRVTELTVATRFFAADRVVAKRGVAVGSEEVDVVFGGLQSPPIG